MKDLKRQDRNGVRTAVDLERRYKFNEIELTKDELEYLRKLIVVDSALSTTSTNPVQNKVVTKALNSKVNVEEGKCLSSNDFTDEYIEQIEENTAKKHTHENKDVLETYTLTEQELLDKVASISLSEYSFYIVTTQNTSVIPITVEEYSYGDKVDVYINGLKLIKGLHFSVSENNVVLTNEVDVVGTEIEIVIKKYN